jgi:preprotein translocase subunit SecA
MAFIDTLNKLLGDPNKKELKRLWPRVEEVKNVLSKMKGLAATDLPRKTEDLKERATDGEPLDALLPEAFALAIRACEELMGKEIEVVRHRQRWDMVPFDVQILGGIVLHEGEIAEMKTGEGKTLVCTMPVVLNALAGKGVHVVTVNDYLAKRDAQWMGYVYTSLGISVGVILHEKNNKERRAAYACDVTYGTNNEFGFDYLRDNMATSLDARVQRSLHYAIVDEVDSILIDEARTPLIISQPAEESTAKYVQYASLVRQLQEHTHFTKDEKQKVATLTEEGIKKMEQLLGVSNIYTEKGFEEVHHIEQALRAHAMYQRDVDYVTKENEVIIVDEFTGRLMPGRRYSHGLHQAIEAKEGVEVQRESKTLATITFQNYFRLYEKLAGMTGTAKTEEEEFEQIYNLGVIVVPTHKTMIRIDKPDAIYRTQQAKFAAVAKIAKEKYEHGQPVLIGTTSVEKSELLSGVLQKLGIPHQVLNAKYHEKEAEIVANAGQRGAVTIATNMAGRGTDIKLGEGIPALGGLCILGTERHEARRIDNQLRGRSGRQGDRGESQFFVSMEDDLMRLFGGDRLKGMMGRLKVPDDVPLENNIVSKAIENAQKKVEGYNFDLRRHVVQYDDVMNKHREIIYARRLKMLKKLSESGSGSGSDSDEKSLHDEILEMLKKEAAALVQVYASDIDPETWNLPMIAEQLGGLHPALKQGAKDALRACKSPEELLSLLERALTTFYEEKCKTYEETVVKQAERTVSLRSLDTHWMEHIDAMSHLREQVAFAGFAHRDPLVEYKDQGFRMFQQLLASIAATTTRTLMFIDFNQFQPRAFAKHVEEEQENLQTNVEEIEEALRETGVRERSGSTSPPEAKPQSESGRRGLASPPKAQPRFRGFASPQKKIGRNEPCPCGSGKKYKKCCGKFT